LSHREISCTRSSLPPISPPSGPRHLLRRGYEGPEGFDRQAGPATGSSTGHHLKYLEKTGAIDNFLSMTNPITVLDKTATGSGTLDGDSVATDRDDLSLLPSTSTNLQDCSFGPLEFLDASNLIGSSFELRYLLTGLPGPARSFRLGDGSNP
jgi:hypothetical protein